MNVSSISQRNKLQHPGSTDSAQDTPRDSKYAKLSKRKDIMLGLPPEKRSFFYVFELDDTWIRPSNLEPL